MAEGREYSFRSGSEVVFDFFCELCIDDNKQVEAEGYCVDCREYLCELCFKAHKRTRSTRDHVLQNKSNMPKDTPLSTDRVNKCVTTKCKVHNNKHVEYYCKIHSVLGCANCFATDHKHCADVESVAQKSENILESQWCKEFMSKLELIQKKTRDIEARARDNKKLSQRCYTDVVSMVRTLKEEVIVMLNEFEQNTVTLAENMMSEDEQKSQSVVDDCKELSEKNKQLLLEFKRLRTSKRVCQLYVNIREKETEVKKFQEKLGKLQEANVVRTFTFERNAELTSLLRSPDALGTISQQYQQVTQSPVATRDPSSITATQLADINVRSSSDTVHCCISGSAVVSNNRLILTDWNNNTVKLVDTHTHTLLSELNVSSRPWDITVFNDNQAAVTLPDSNKILIVVKVSPSLTEEREIAVRGKCRGIAYSKGRLLVTFDDKPRLEIIDLRGNVIRTIENGSDGSKLFKWPWYVCVSINGEPIYVSDCSHHTVTSLTCDGVVKAIYEDETLSNPRKVCTDHHGNVYVCCYSSKNVHMMTADCKKIKVILTEADGLDSTVWSVSYCQDTNRLFIGMVKDTVKVYQLS